MLGTVLAIVKTIWRSSLNSQVTKKIRSVPQVAITDDIFTIIN